MQSTPSPSTTTPSSAAASHGNADTDPPLASPASAPLSALCLIARLHHLAADPAHLAHQLGWPPSFEPRPDDLLLAAQHLGLKAKRSRSTTDRLALVPLPALATIDDGQGSTRTVVLAQCDGQRVLFLDPAGGGSSRPAQPTIEPLDVFAAQWTGELILITSRASLAGALARFDFSWFIPAIVKYRRLLGEALIVSLFLQLFALVSPLFFQVVMDKVLVHRGQTTLDVLVIGLIVVTVFESVLTVLRSYVFSHTTSRIDVELGARLFRHLVSLPLAYFQARRVGDSVARVRELENIRSFLTGNAITLVLDVAFSLVFIAVMFTYSVPLTLIVLASLPLYAGISLVLVPILRARLNEKFARGAENQALLVETITGIQTVKASALEPVLAKRWDQQLAGSLFGIGDGIDSIVNDGGADGAVDVLRLGAGITTDNIKLSGRNPLTLTVVGTGDAISFAGPNDAATAKIERIEFADGTVWTEAQWAPRALLDAATSGADWISAFSTTANTSLIGLGGNDHLTTYGGKDNLDGGADDDTLDSGDGDDTLLGGVGNDTLTAGSGNDSLDGGAGLDYLNGGDGNDTLINGETIYGGNGSDTYFVDAAGDTVNEYPGEGTDAVLSSVAFVLGTDVENLTLTGTGAINGTGNASDNVLIGNSVNNTLTGAAGNDTLDGGMGNDTMVGGAGNDSYTVDSSADVVTESSSQGTDTVSSSVACTLSANVENLILTGTNAINGTGNTLANVLTGNAAANTLNGGTGADTMIGGAGNDSYTVDSTADVITENASEGTDTVNSSVTYTLATNVENLTLTGTSTINGTGNTLDNVLTGNSANNTLTGAAGNDTLDGGTGSDTMLGGTGNDTYWVNVSTDVVTENANEGTDTVNSSATYTLAPNVENLTLTGSSTINATGNALANVLTGNGANNTLTGAAGNDTLDGGLGSDTMVGGLGDDTYFVNVSTDVITEKTGEGTDTVQSAVTWTLSTNLENLTLTGTTAINGTGNASANTLIGNGAANTLAGAEGSDIYDGGAGNDVLSDTSISSSDTYRWGLGMGTDTITDKGGSLDHVDLFAGITKAQLKFVQNASNLELSVIGQTDKLVISNWYTSSANQIEEFRLSDGSKVLASEVQSLISAMAAFSAPADGMMTTGQVAPGMQTLSIMAPQQLMAA